MAAKRMRRSEDIARLTSFGVMKSQSLLNNYTRKMLLVQLGICTVFFKHS